MYSISVIFILSHPNIPEQGSGSGKVIFLMAG